MRERRFLSSLGFRVAMSVPSKRTFPSVGAVRWRRARPRVVLPQPDSPTRPRVSPRKTSKLMSSIAFVYSRTLPKRVLRLGYQTRRFVTWMMGWGDEGSAGDWGIGDG